MVTAILVFAITAVTFTVTHKVFICKMLHSDDSSDSKNVDKNRFGV